jgi:Malectin domain
MASAGFENEKLELESLLASGIFNRAPNLAHLLRYVCERHFEGAADQIKEYNIAVEALGRPPDFDQKRDSIVRVEAHRLRKRLKEFYEAEGTGHPVKIEIPPGQYVPRFMTNGTAHIEAEPLPTETASPIVENPAPVPMPAPAPAGGKRRTALTATAAIALVIALGAWFRWPGRPISKASVEAAVTLPASSGAAGIVPQGAEVRILAGYLSGPYTDSAGRIWQSDHYFTGGSAFDSGNRQVAGSRDPRIYQTRREGAFSYDIPLPPGTYELRLHFAETLYGEMNAAGGGETSRLFNISINGSKVLDQFDVISDAGANTADIRVFKDISPAADGKLHLNFEPHANLAFVDAIEITPGTRGHMQPIRMVARHNPYIDGEGRIWEPDRYARGGQLVVRADPVAGATDQELFRGERYGNIQYVIPVAPGKYGLTMHFAELWFGPGTAAGGGIGSRLFDIFCNGVVLRRNFDIFKEAHGSAGAVRISAHGLEPNAQGKLVISLEPVRNYACVNAIEVIDETK